MGKDFPAEVYILALVLFLILGIASFRYDPVRPLPTSTCFLLGMARDMGISVQRDERCMEE